MVDLKNFLKNIWFTIIKKYDTTKESKVYAEWEQRYFEIYCSNCGKEARIKKDYSDYIYYKRCPHCKAYMKNCR